MSEHKNHIAKLKEKLELLNAQNAVLRKTDENNNLQMLNGMGDLLQSAQLRQENITSWNPIITNNQYALLTLNYVILMYMYSTHGLIQTAIDQPVLDAHKERVGLTSNELTPRNLEELEQWLEENEVWEPFIDTQVWGRLFGGAAMMLNLAGDPSKPINYKELERGRFALYPAARWELGSTWRYANSYNFYGMNFDRSRVMTFIGKRMPWIIERQLSGWGASLIARMNEDFNMYLRTRNVLYELLNEAKIDVYRINGYTNQLQTQTGTQQVDQRVAITNGLKSFHSALILDKEDEFDQKQIHLAGLAEIMRENRIGLVSALRIPVSKLFGTGSKGFSSGEDDLENYDGMVESEVRRPAIPLLNFLLKLGVMAVFGKPYHVSFEYPPLREMEGEEAEKVKTSEQNRIVQQLEMGLIDEAEAAAWAKRSGLTPITTKMGNRGDKRLDADKKDAKPRDWRKNPPENEKGADHAKRESSGMSGDGRQVPKFG